MKVRLRPKYKFIPDDHGVYLLRAGPDYQFYHHFLSDDLVFLNFPNLTLAEDFELTDDKKREFQRAKAQADFERNRGEWARPSRDLAAYHPEKGEIGVNHKEMRGRSPVDSITFSAVETVYKNLKTGDLVVVPGPGRGDGRVLIGEVVEPYNGLNTARVFSRTTEEELVYPAVKVSWLATTPLKKDFSVAAYKSFGHNRVLHSLGRSVREEVYDHAYGEYSFGEASTINVKVDAPGNNGEANWDADAYSAAQMQNLILYYCGAYEALRAGDFERYSALSVYEALDDLYVKNFPLVWETLVRSPGSVTYRAQNRVKCLFVGLVLALSAHADISADELHQVEIEIEDAWGTIPEDCSEELQELVSNYQKMVAITTWIRNCDVQRDYHDKIGGEPSSAIEVEIER